MDIEESEIFRKSILTPTPYPKGFKRKHPTSYRFTPYSPKLKRRLDIYTVPAFDLWAHLEWSTTITLFNERVINTPISCDTGKIINLVPPYISLDHNKNITMHLFRSTADEADKKSLYAYDDNQIEIIAKFARLHAIAVITWTAHELYRNTIELENWKRLLRFSGVPELFINPSLTNRILSTLKQSRKTTISSLIASLPDEDPELIKRALAVAIQDRVVYTDISIHPLGPATELSAYHDLWQ